MEFFKWARFYETGIESVDSEHHGLVSLLNHLGSIQGRDVGSAETVRILDELIHYAAVHFANEEALMEDHRVDPRHVSEHRREHADFVHEVLRQRQHLAEVDMSFLLRFLSSWLAFHILGSDRHMGEQIHAIQQGTPPAHAYEHSEAPHDPANAALLNALHTLYQLVGNRNALLLQVNQQLESRVQERTQALEQAHSDLRQAEQKALLGELAGQIAHEINNPLGFVASNTRTLARYVQTLLARLPHTPDNAALCAEISGDFPELYADTSQGLERVSHIVQQLLQLANCPPDHADLPQLMDELHQRLYLSGPR